MSKMGAMAVPARSRPALLAATLLLICVALWSGETAAQPVPTMAPPSPQAAPLTQSAASLLPKTILYAVVASGVDVAIGSLITGGVVTGTAMAVVASTSGWLLYQVHEMTWAALGPKDQTSDQMVLKKATTFTVANVARLFGVGMLFTQNVALSASFVVLDAIGDVASYVVTDRVWGYLVSTPAAATTTGRLQ
jgi:uncharacterized membrane protein